MQIKRRRFLQSFLGAMAAIPVAPVLNKLHAAPSVPFQGLDEPELWRLVRKSFPLTTERVYLNAGGLGPSPYPVLDAVESMRHELETISETGHHHFDEIRAKVAAFVGADDTEIAFTRNATEGMNFIARGVVLQPGDEVLTTTHEHPGGAMPWLAVAKDTGIRVRLFEPENDPQKMLETIRKHLTPKTRVLMLSHMTCTLGTVFPVKEICALAKERGIISVLDGAQPLSQIPVDLHDIGCDYYTTSGHKWLLGPKETGFIYIAKDVRPSFKPSFVGAYSNVKYDLDKLELTYRMDSIVNEYGTRDAAKINGVGAAVDFMNAIGPERVFNRLHTLAMRLKPKLQEIPGVELLTPMDNASSGGIVTFRIKGMDYQKVSGILGEKFKLRVRNVGEHHINAIRASLHIYISEEEVDRVANAVAKIAKGEAQ